MTHRLLFFAVTTLVGWVFQMVFLYLAPAALPTPHWLLLAVLALGSRGHIRLAMGLGFLWGLAVDAHGMTAFGVQGWLLMTAGYASGILAKKLNAEKWVTQETLALGGTVLLWMGVRLLARFFHPAVVGHPTLGLALGQILLNTLVAPAVFWAMAAWLSFWGHRPGESHA